MEKLEDGVRRSEEIREGMKGEELTNGMRRERWQLRLQLEEREKRN